MKQRIFEIIEPSKDRDILSSLYDIFIMAAVVASLVPLAFKEQTEVFIKVDEITTCIFVADYLLRWFTADRKFGDKSIKSYIRYPFTLRAIVDLMAILPSLSLMGGRFSVFSSFKLLRFVRVFRTMRVFNIFRATRYTKSIKIIKKVIANCKESLVTAGYMEELMEEKKE